MSVPALGSMNDYRTDRPGSWVLAWRVGVGRAAALRADSHTVTL